MEVLNNPLLRPVDEKLKRLLRACFAMFLLLLLSGQDLPAATVTSQEYQLKAAFVFNFLHFVKWPPTAFRDAQSPVVIGILGEDPFGAALDETVRGEKMDGRSIIIRRYRKVQDIQTCQLLFVSRSEATRMRAILNALKGRNILTVADFEDFATAGGMIRFVTAQNKVRFRINLAAAEEAHLTISSQLLRAAEIAGEAR